MDATCSNMNANINVHVALGFRTLPFGRAFVPVHSLAVRGLGSETKISLTTDSADVPKV